jgi:uncharacterized protein (TIGR02599 family)
VKEAPPNARRAIGFTLVELLVSMAVLSLLVVVMASILNQTTTAWRSARGKIEQFRQARDAFESMSRKISQSTLNAYWDYLDANGATRTAANSSTFAPVRYARQSELRFISGPALAGTATGAPPRPTHSIFFVAPFGEVEKTDYSGLQNLLNTWGYYVEYADDSKLRPDFVTIPTKSRFRLMELMQPSEAMTLYSYTSGNSTYAGKEWFTGALAGASAPVHVLAENVIALVILPKLAPKEDPTGALLSPAYTYDSTVKRATAAINSKNQLPPVVQITIVAIDETSANRLTAGDNAALQTKLGGLFTDATQYAADLTTLEQHLLDNKIKYQIFTTSVSIKGAKWSREQVN